MDELKLKKIGRRIAANLVDSRIHEDWSLRFRASAMPFCQLKYAWFVMDKALGELPGSSRKFIADFYMDVGTAVHSAAQRWLSRMGILFGNWRCENPLCASAFVFDDRGDPVPIVLGRLGPQHCPSCGKALVYCELSFLDPPTGHCDGLIKYGALTSGELDFVLLEVKTIGDRKLRTEVKVDGPPMEYKIQVSLYTHKLIERGYNIKGVLFLFIPREDPQKIWPYWYHVGPKKAARIHDSIFSDYMKAKTCGEAKNFNGLSGSCQTVSDARNCPYRVNCFSPKALDFFAEKLVRFVEIKGEQPGDIERALNVSDLLPMMPTL